MKDCLAVTIIDKMRPDRVTMEARNKLEKAIQKCQLAEHKRNQAANKRLEFIEKKQRLQDEIAAKKEKLFGLTTGAKDL